MPVNVREPGAFEAAFFDPTSQEMRGDPWELFRRMRELSPIYESPFGALILTGYDHSVAALRDPRLSVDPKNATVLTQTVGGNLGLAERGFDHIMLFVDPPEHTRLRALVNKAFSARVVESMKARIEQVVDELLDAALARQSFDLMTEFAYPLPVTVICEMLGVPANAHASLRAWTAAITPMLDPFVRVDTFERASEAGLALVSYLEKLIEHRRAHPAADLLSELIRAEEEGQKLSPEELRATCILLLIAGHETTMNVIGNGTLALLRHPRQWRRLRGSLPLIRTAVEELVRYAGPGSLTARIALEDMDIGGKPLKKGQIVLVMLGAANRDPRAFPDPERFDITRDPNRHIGFGAGPHFCMGASLARAELQIALRRLTEKAPELHLAGEPEWRPMVTFRGLSRLPVAI